MGRTVAIMAMVLLSCAVGHAQTSMGSSTSPSALGATSPLGIPGATSPSTTGIPLGATEIDPGGLGVVPGATSSNFGCISTGTLPGSGSTTTSTATGSSTFDGGGMTSVAPTSGTTA